MNDILRQPHSQLEIWARLTFHPRCLVQMIESSTWESPCFFLNFAIGWMPSPSASTSFTFGGAGDAPALTAKHDFLQLSAIDIIAPFTYVMLRGLRPGCQALFFNPRGCRLKIYTCALGATSVTFQLGRTPNLITDCHSSTGYRRAAYLVGGWLFKGDSMDPQRIIELRASNIKRIKVVRINPDGSVVIIGGRNEQGKSSLLDCITYALSGKGAACPRPVREGAASGKVVLDLTDLTVTRTFTKKGGSTLTVKGKDGAEKKSPQGLLNSLYNQLSFDPLAFTKMGPKVQADKVRELVGIDFAHLDKDRKRIYDDRAEVNRALASRKASLGGMEEYPDAPEVEVSVVDLFEQLKAVEAGNSAIDAMAEDAACVGGLLTVADNEVRRLENDLNEAKKTLAALIIKRDEKQLALSQAERVDPAPLNAAIAGADEVNRKVRANNARVEASAAVKKLSSNYDYATWQIDAIDDKKRAMLEGAKWPIDGLSFGDEGILVGGLPFEQASSAQQLKVSVAMGLAMNPTLKVLLIRDGSLLDEDSMALMQKMAEDADAQIFIERVGKGDECQVIIEDGMVEEQGPIFDDGPEVV